MSEKSLKIARLISDAVLGIISPADQKELDKWLVGAESHRELYEYLKTAEVYRDKEALYSRFDRYYNPERLRKRLRKQRHSLRMLWIRKYTAMIAFPLIFITALVVWLQRENEITVSGWSDLKPGKSSAVLVLSGGEARNLTSGLSELTEGKVKIVNENGRLSYAGLPGEDGADTAVTYHEIQVPRGGEYQLILADGTQLWLNSGSSVRFPVEFKGNERQIQVTGEVFLEVTKDSLHPFIVRTKYIAVNVLGTKFNIRDYGDEETVMTTLVEGQIKVGSEDGKTFFLEPSEQYIYDKQKQTGEVREVDTDLFVSWKDGIYLFKSQRLEDILKLISQWYDLHVFYQNQEAKDILFSGRLKRYENVGTLLHVFERLGGVSFSVQGKTVIVKKE